MNNKTQNIVVTIPTDKVTDFIKDVSKNNSVKYVEPNWKSYIDATPNDPEWINQWGPRKIQANLAWNRQRNNSTVLVAVIDTGIKYDHPDLAANYAPLGYDWVNNDPYPMDDHGHGTHCAGIIAATINNSVGIAGLAQVKVMAEKALTREGWGYDDNLANAIIHAVDHGAKIISCSWGSSEDSQLIRDAIRYATSAGALVIAAAGNSGTNTKHYPAAYPEVIAVTATDENDNLASFSTYGDWVDLAAPGTSIYSTYLWNTYVSLSGTSMACPHVAGVAALVWSRYPEMTNEQVRSQLFYTADDLGSDGFDIHYGHGRVNARKAVANSIALIGSKVADASTNSVHFLYVNPDANTKPDTAYDAIASGILYGFSSNTQQQQFTSAADLTYESGELNTSKVNNSVVVLFGGPCAQKTVGYYEEEGLAPLRFTANSTHYMFVTQANVTVAALGRNKVVSGYEDMFIIEVFTDKTNLFVIMYGFGWKGTWAGGIYFKEVISHNFNDYSEGCYLFHWIDDSAQDGVPQSSEIHKEDFTP
jgi:subtilisin family serine protease